NPQVLQLAGDAWECRHEAHVDELLAFEAGIGPGHAYQGLGAVMRSDRRNQDAARLQPLQQRFRNLLHRRSSDDTVELAAWDVRRVEAVSQQYFDVVAAQLLQPDAGAVGQGPVAFDGQHLPTQPRQNSSLVARAGT